MITGKQVGGSYILAISVRESRLLEVGSLGQIIFKPGWYLYVGSALPGIKPRIRRHINKKKTPHWHVDYLSNAFTIKYVALFVTDQRMECLIVENLKKVLIPIPRFGSSDCECGSHLFYAENEEKMRESIEQTFSAVKPDAKLMNDADIRRYLR